MTDHRLDSCLAQLHKVRRLGAIAARDLRSERVRVREGSPEVAVDVVGEPADERLSFGVAVDDGTGYLVYSNSLLIMMVPHAIVTVSLATAILPRLSSYAHDDRLADLGSTVGSTSTST